MVRRLTWLLLFAACAQPAPPPKPDAAPAPTPSASPGLDTMTATQAAPRVIAASELAAQMDATRERLEGFIKEGVSDASSPWAMAHGLLAFGPELMASDGRKAIDAIVAAAERDPKTKRLVFPGKTPAGGIADAHPNLSVKKMIEAGVPWDRSFAAAGGKVTLEGLAEQALAGFKTPSSAHDWSDAAWTITIAIKEAKHRKKLDPADERRLKGLALETLAQLESEQDFLAQLLEERRPDKVEKRKQKIYAQPCGGLHFVQAALYSAWLLGDASAYARARKQLEVVMFRWIAEREIYRKTAVAQPQYALLVRTQELKFYGHVLEVFSLAHALGIVGREPELVVQVGGVVQDLLRTIELLAPAYQHLSEVRAGAPQTYLDLVGDGAHAVHGLREGVVAFFRPQ